uniref:Uncharacterized protein n=1 Tax=Plectus sambesii TaxID=2011161 RepID=A0A914VVQ4_9BILA
MSDLWCKRELRLPFVCISSPPSTSACANELDVCRVDCVLGQRLEIGNDQCVMILKFILVYMIEDASHCNMGGAISANSALKTSSNTKTTKP